MKNNLFITLVFLWLNASNTALCIEKQNLVSDSVEDYIKEFKEPIYLTTNNKIERYLIRLTFIRSHQSHVMISWYPYDDEFKNSYIHVKKLRRVKPQGEFEIFYDKKTNMSKNSSTGLLQIFDAQKGFKPSETKDWKGLELDGQQWIYEFVDKSTGFGLERISPLHDIPEELEKISKERIVKEMRLTAFGVALWAISKNGETIEL